MNNYRIKRLTRKFLLNQTTLNKLGIAYLVGNII